jgi:virginiamycin A acetyltransferase
MKFVVKRMVRVVALLLILPGFVLYRLSTVLLGAQKAFPGWAQAFSLAPGLCGVYLRHAFFALVLPRCDTNACVGFGTVFSHPSAELGRNVYVGPFCSLGDVTLEDDVLLGSHVSIANGGSQHGIERTDIPIREQPGAWPRITIGQDSWIGDRAVILANVGKHCVVGAGSVVTKPLPDYSIAVGVPAKVVGYRNRPHTLSPEVEERMFSNAGSSANLLAPNGPA